MYLKKTFQLVVFLLVVVGSNGRIAKGYGTNCCYICAEFSTVLLRVRCIGIVRAK